MNRYITYILHTKYAFTLLIAVFAHSISKAQINPLGLMYFQNQYLGNPALAGMEKGVKADLSYRKQWTDIPGTPATQAGTVSYGMTERTGLGLLITNDQAGLLKRTKVAGTYAYHLPINSLGDQLSFGISLGYLDQRVDPNDIRGVQNDVVVGAVNSRESYIDGDFGVADTNQQLTLQAAVPNLKEFFQQDRSGLADRTTFYTAVSYKLKTDGILEGSSIEPKVSIMGIRSNGNIWDAGFNYMIVDQVLNSYIMYRSTGAVTTGMGIVYRQLCFSGMYTSATKALSSYTNGNFELGMTVRLFK